MQSLDREKILAICPAMFRQVIGGEDVEAAMIAHHHRGESVRSIARATGVPSRTLFRKMKVAEATMKRLGLWEAFRR